MRALPEIVKQEMLARVQEEIQTAMLDRHIIVDDWFPFDADWEINIWTSEGLTKASAYESDNGVVNTGEWIDLFEGRLSWPTNLANNVRLSRDEEGQLRIWAECADRKGALHWVDVTWLDLADHELFGEKIP